MKKENIRIKERMSNADIIGFANDYIQLIFPERNGHIDYAPYMRDYAWKAMVLLYAVEGYEFEDGDDLESCLRGIPNIGFIRGRQGDALRGQLNQLEKDLRDLEAFKKQELLNVKSYPLGRLIDTVTDKISQFDVKSLDSQSLADAVVQAYLNSMKDSPENIVEETNEN